jgi:hypothetical protein
VVGVSGWGDGDCVSELEPELMSDPGESGLSATAAAKWAWALESQARSLLLALAVAAESADEGARPDERMALVGSRILVLLVEVDARGSVPTVSPGFWNKLPNNFPMSNEI